MQCMKAIIYHVAAGRIDKDLLQRIIDCRLAFSRCYVILQIKQIKKTNEQSLDAIFIKLTSHRQSWHWYTKSIEP